MRTLNRICKVCNEGWMSKLQDIAKPVIIGLRETGDTAGLSAQDRETLAKWFTMTSMAFESDHPQGRFAVSEIERQRFSANQIIGPTWRIWIGSVINDVKGGRGISHLPNSNGSTMTQRTIMQLGTVLFMSSSGPAIRAGEAHLPSWGMRKIWPENERNFGTVAKVSPSNHHPRILADVFDGKLVD